MKKLFTLLFLCFSIAAFSQQTTTVTLTGKLVSKAPDATTVTYIWKHIAGTGGVITSPTFLITTVTGLPVGIHDFELTGTDNFGASGKDITRVTVIRASIPPVIDAGEDQSVNLGSTSLSLPKNNSQPIDLNKLYDATSKEQYQLSLMKQMSDSIDDYYVWLKDKGYIEAGNGVFYKVEHVK